MKKALWLSVFLAAFAVWFVSTPVFFFGPARQLTNEAQNDPAPADTNGIAGDLSFVSVAQAAGSDKGVDVSGLAQVESIGFFSVRRPENCGKITASASDRVILAKGGIVSVMIKKGCDANPGDLFRVCGVKILQKDALSGNTLGYVVSYKGKIVLKQQLKGSLYQAEIVENFTSLSVGDRIIPFEPLSACVKLEPADPAVKSEVITGKESRNVFSQWSIVYLPSGYNQGVRRGNVFQIIKKKADEDSANPLSAEMVLGHVLILEARPDTAAGVVTDTKEEFGQGILLKGAEWEEARKVLAHLRECSLE